jgi:hypothetical protein
MPHAYVCALCEYMCASASVQDEIGKHPDVDMIGYVRENTLVQIRDTPYSRSVIPLFSCPLSWSVHYNFSGDGSCRIMMEAVVPSWKLSRLLTVAMSKQDFSATKLKCNFFVVVYKLLLTNVFT